MFIQIKYKLIKIILLPSFYILKVPQLDITTYTTQWTWTLITLALFYVFLTQILLPQIRKTIILRKTWDEMKQKSIIYEKEIADWNWPRLEITKIQEQKGTERALIEKYIEKKWELL
jgi:DNA primase